MIIEAKTPRGTITIRQAKIEDAHAYRGLRLEALRNHPEAFTSDFETNVERPITYWEESLRALGEEAVIYFAEIGGELVGMSGLYWRNAPKIKHAATIWGVYVRPEWRGLHIAEKLIAVCTDWAREHAKTILKLEVAVTNTPAIKCYTRIGFRVYGVDPQVVNLDGVFYDELLMSRQV